MLCGYPYIKNSVHAFENIYHTGKQYMYKMRIQDMSWLTLMATGDEYFVFGT